MDPTLDAVLAPLRASPERTLLAFDFDGTLSPVVDDPAAAVAFPGVADLLDRLAQTYAGVAVVSGRPISFLTGQLPPSVDLSGLYGLEERIDGRTRVHPEADRWRPALAEAAAKASSRCGPGGPLAGAVVEPKGLSLTLHVRTHPELEASVRALADELAVPAGLEVRPAKRSVELHPPVAADKGTAVRALASGLDAVLYVGDDVGDLPAFEAVAELARAGTIDVGVTVAVGGAELPAAVAERVDAVLPAPGAIVDLLGDLAPAARS